jgi:hypothetical protein
MSTSLPVDSSQHAVPYIKRPNVNYSPSIWGDIFLQYDSEAESMVLLYIYIMRYIVLILEEYSQVLFFSSLVYF